MVLKKIDCVADYVDYLRQNPMEVGELYQDILINVTSFFRDPEAFETLKSLVFPAIMKNKVPGEAVRIWVAGCSTGEEAYSIAIVLTEFLGEDAVNTPIQIFATDINEKLIEKARVGIYPKSIKADVSLERLRRFIIKVDSGYQINKTVRDMCIFARQELAKDPPFSRLDLISCRNMIIYFGSAMQKKLFPVFHYSLKENSFLFLGASESVGTHATLFNLVDKKHKLYSKKAVTIPLIYEFSASFQWMSDGYRSTSIFPSCEECWETIVSYPLSGCGRFARSLLWSKGWHKNLRYRLTVHISIYDDFVGCRGHSISSLN